MGMADDDTGRRLRGLADPGLQDDAVPDGEGDLLLGYHMRQRILMGCWSVQQAC
jgi:hypothetical protein